jgi:nitronate monooxygenase
MSKPVSENILSALKRMTDDLSTRVPFRGLREPFRNLRIPSFSWPSLRIGEKVARVPVIQGGMGVGISLSGLASAVAEAGGIGVIAANAIGMLEKDYFKDGRAANLRALRREIRTARQKTKGLLGVNIMVAVNDFHELLDIAVEEKVDLVIMGAGLPVKGIPVEQMRKNGVKAVPIVSSARAADMIFRMWKKTYNDVPDAVICEGPLAGGHLGFSPEQIEDPEFQLESIVPQIVDALKPYEAEFGRAVPVIAAGGIYTGDDVHGALGLGAAGVQMGTRFVATNECDADLKFKQAYVDSTEDQIGLIKSPVGMPGRAIRNAFIQDSEEGRRPSFRCAWQCLASCNAEEAKYCISIALNNARKGKLDKGFVFVGANAHRVREIVPVASLIGELADGYRQASRESVMRPLEGLVAKVQDLWREYDGLGTRVGELTSNYESAIRSRIRDARDIGTEKLRKQYNAMLVRLRELQFQIAEGLADSWAVLNPLMDDDRG